MLRVLGAALLLATVLLAACGGGDGDDTSGETAASGSITGVEWQWQGSVYNNDTEATPDDPSTYTITFQEDGTYVGQADCNRIRGSYTLDGSSITIEPAASTKAACPEGSLFGEYVRDLEGVAIVTIQDGDLIADIRADVGTMRFSPAG